MARNYDTDIGTERLLVIISEMFGDQFQHLHQKIEQQNETIERLRSRVMALEFRAGEVSGP